MPRLNGTGPMGQGAGTGRGLGPCGSGMRLGWGRVKQLRIIAEPPSVLQLKMSLNEELVF